MTTKDSLFLGIGTIAIIASAGVVGVKVFSSNESASSSTVTTNSVQSASSSNTIASTSSTTYTDGTYSASSSYYVPHGTNSISATVTIKNNIITAVSTSDQYSDRESGMYIDSFKSYLDSSANGQSLDSYSPSRIGGASLTTQAFTDVLDQIRTDAAV